MARLITLAFLLACGCLVAGHVNGTADETAPAVEEEKGKESKGEEKSKDGEAAADEKAAAAPGATGKGPEAEKDQRSEAAADEKAAAAPGATRKEPKAEKDTGKSKAEKEQPEQAEQPEQDHDQEQPEQAEQPEQDHYQNYMKHYLPPGDMKYADSFVGKNADWRQYMDANAASADYMKYIKKNGGPQADYQKYVELYSAMAGAHPTSGKDWQQDKTQQLSAWSNAMDKTYQTYIPGSYQHFAQQSTNARATPGNDYQKFSAAYGSSQNYTSGGKGAADYQQYMDYQKYMQGGQGGAGDYKQYMDYQKYMQGGQGGQGGQTDDNATTLAAVGGGGGYQQYMDYQKYMQGGQGGAGDYKQYMDYQKYMQGAQGSQGGAGGYQQYMDYQKYMQGGQGGAGDYKQYMDYQKYMPGAQGDKATNLVAVAGSDKESNASQAGGGYQQYMDYQKYIDNQKHMQAAAQMPPPEQCNTTEQLNAWRDAQLEQLGQWMPKAYSNYARAPIEQRYQKNLARLRGEKYEEPVMLHSAAECNTTEQLRQWRDQKEADVKKYTPAAYRQYAVAPIQQEYEKQLARLKGEPSLEPAPQSAADCKTEAQLNSWRKSQESQMQYVPAAFRQNALGPIRQEYEKNLARLRAAKSEAEKAADNSASAAGSNTDAKSDGGAAKGDHSDTEASAGSASQPPAAPASVDTDSSTSSTDASKAADSQVPASADGASSADDTDTSKAAEAPANSATGSAASTPADATSAGEGSTASLASMHLARDASFMSGTPRLLLAVCAGLALPASVAFASRAFSGRPRTEGLENADTPFLLLDNVA